jgi:hypothetical protein
VYGRPVNAREFTGLLDTPSVYTGEGGRLVAVKPTETGLEFVDPGTVGPDGLLDLSDTPSDYSGAGGQVLAVKDTEDGVEFTSLVPLTIRDQDGTPTVTGVKMIKVTNGSLTDEGSGVVLLDTTGGVGGNSSYSDVYASRPAASNDGDLFLPSDGPTIQRDTGAAWVPWGPLFPLTEPPSSGWTTVGLGSSTITPGKGTRYGYFLGVFSAGVALEVRSAPSTPYTIEAAFLAVVNGDPASSGPALFFRESSSGKIIIWRLLFAGSIGLHKWDNPTAYNSQYVNVAIPQQVLGAVIWLRIQDDGVNRTVALSADGQNWLNVHAVGRTDFLTADQVGWGCEVSSMSGRAAGITLLSWKES